MIRTKTVSPGPAHDAFHSDVCDLLNRHGENLTVEEMLAVASKLVGRLVAMQDQRTMTSEKAMALIERNIEAGNRDMVEQLMKSKGSA